MRIISHISPGSERLSFITSLWHCFYDKLWHSEVSGPDITYSLRPNRKITSQTMNLSSTSFASPSQALSYHPSATYPRGNAISQNTQWMLTSNRSLYAIPHRKGVRDIWIPPFHLRRGKVKDPSTYLSAKEIPETHPSPSFFASGGGATEHPPLSFLAKGVQQRVFPSEK